MSEPNWPVLLVASDLAVFGITKALEAAEQKKFGVSLKFLTLATTLLFLTYFAGSGRPLLPSLGFVARRMPLLPFVLITVLAGAVYAVGSELVFDLSIRWRALVLAPKLDIFAKQCQATKSRSSLSTEREAEEQRQQIKYVETFGSEIIDIDRGFVRRGISYSGLIDSYLGARDNRELTTFDRAELTSKLMQTMGSVLPLIRRWRMYTIFRRFMLWLASAAAVGLLLFASRLIRW